MHVSLPAHRVYCMSRNYAAHARDVGTDPTREEPFFFTKPARAVVPSVPEVIAELSTLYASGIGPVVRGERLEGGIDGF